MAVLLLPSLLWGSTLCKAEHLVSTQLISRAVGLPTTADGTSFAKALSANGQWVLFGSDAPNLISGTNDGNDAQDVFLFDRTSGATTLVSRALGAATTTANGISYPIDLSADGQWVVFGSDATNIASGVTDSNGVTDVYLFDQMTGATMLVSRAFNSATTTANGISDASAISADGRWLLFRSGATNLLNGVTDTNGANLDVFLFDRVGEATTLVSRALGSPTSTPNNQSLPTAMSADGAWVLFYSGATNVISGVNDVNGSQHDAFLFDRMTEVTTLVSRSSISSTTTGNAQSEPTAISADGQRIVFWSTATNVVSGVTDNNAGQDAFLFDRVSGENSLVSRSSSSAANTANFSHTYPPTISGDGQTVLLRSEATDLVGGVTDSNGQTDAFLFDRSNGSMALISHAFDSATTTANNYSEPTAISEAGQHVLYYSSATNLVNGAIDGNGTYDLFLFDRAAESTTLVSRASGPAATTPNDRAEPTSLSADGQWVLYNSLATNVVDGVADENGDWDAFLARVVPIDLFSDGFEAAVPHNAR